MTDTCILAGTFLSKVISATDPNNQILKLEVDGGPFHVTNPIANFNANNSIGASTGTLNWQTSCAHIRKAPYQVTVKVSDGGSPVSLVDFKTFNITVVAPPPQNLTAKPIGSNIELRWTKPTCHLTTGNKILNYCVYRKSDCNFWAPANCEVGVPAYTGYVKIGCTASVNDTLMLDTNNGAGLSQGTNYSYLVVAIYSDNAESYASNQVCVQLKRDVPLLINADVQTTNTTTGAVFVRWIKPRLGFNALDTTSITGPYEFRLMHHDNFSGTFTQIYSVTNNFFAGLNQLSDTTFVHALNLNTQAFAHTYKIEFYANGQFIGNGQKGSSVFLSSVSSDNKISLSWTHQVPWNNFSYDLYRKDPAQTTFTLIGSTSSQSYADNNLINGIEYCYKVQAKGQYADPSILSPLLNFSQEICAKPIDQTPPCAPTATVVADCIAHTLKLTWNNPNNTCSDDAVKYNLYYSPTENDSLQLFQTFINVNDTVFALDDTISIAGCYAITALDSFNNESLHTAKVCADNCPEYELPNVITVNGDGVNDFFKPIKNKYIKDIDLKIYNRWGSLVFETSDPKIMWDGKVIQTKQLCVEGTYFYVCEVNEIRVAGIISRTLKGFVQVFHK